MKDNRLWQIGTAIAIVVVIALGWVLGISPKVAEIAASDAATRDVEAQNAQQQATLAGLQKLATNKVALEAELTALELSIPPGTDIQSFLLQLNSLASANSTTITSIAPSLAFTYAPDETAAVVPQATVDPANFVLIPISIKLKGSYQSILNFTQGLQSGERLFLVSNVSLTRKNQTVTVDAGLNEVPGQSGYEGEVSGYIFVLLDPNAPAPDPSATPGPVPTPTESATPSPTDSATPTATPSPTPTATP